MKDAQAQSDREERDEHRDLGNPAQQGGFAQQIDF